MLSKKDKSYISVARYFSTKSNAKKMHGAVIVKGGRVLGTGYNRNKNHPAIVSPEHIKTNCSVHAEESAIKDANYDVKGAILYVARTNRHGEDRDSEPCPRCNVLIKQLGIKRVIYTTNSGRVNVSN
jgi:deoxycytidylate deaminase